jgi:hypothetical protein
MVPLGAKVENHGDLTYVYSEDAKALEKLAASRGGIHEAFRIRASGLEDVFLKLTGREIHEGE